MTFGERFEFDNLVIIEIIKNKISKLTEDASTVGTYIDMVTLLKDYGQSETEYLAIQRIYNSIIESPLVLNANSVSETYTRESYFNQAQSVCEIVQDLKTDFIVCGCAVSAYIKLSQNFKRADSDPKGIYKIGTFVSGIELYKAPPKVLPTDEFIYYDNDLATFKKGKIINIYDRTSA